MSIWRKKALEFIPEFRKDIESCESSTLLWSDLSYEFLRALKVDNQVFIQGVLEYLKWSVSDYASEETQQAVYCGFLEDIVKNKLYWPLFSKWFNQAEFNQYKNSFQYTLSEVDYNDFENVFYGK